MGGKKTVMICMFLVSLGLVFPLIAQQQAEKPAKDGQGITENTTGTDTRDNSGKIPEMDMPLDGSASFIQSLMALTFVLGMIFLTAYLYKRFTGVRTRGFGGNRVPIQMVGTMALGEKRFLTIVEIQGNFYFLGVTQNSVNMLSKLDLDLPESPSPESGGDFESIFKKARQLLQKGHRKDN